MTAGSAAGHAVLRDLRAAEAARVLGLLDLDSLPDRARGWVADGICTPAAYALAAGAPRVGSPDAAVLVATLAAEHDVSIHEVTVARTVLAESAIGLLASGGDFSGAVFRLSNSVTDRATDGARNWWRRHRPR